MMPLDELHERRLATVMNLFEDALDRIELLLKGAEQLREADTESRPEAAAIGNIQLAVRRIRRRLQSAAERFEVNRPGHIGVGSWRRNSRPCGCCSKTPLPGA
jgi:hypothetical protein